MHKGDENGVERRRQRRLNHRSKGIRPWMAGPMAYPSPQVVLAFEPDLALAQDRTLIEEFGQTMLATFVCMAFPGASD